MFGHSVGAHRNIVWRALGFTKRNAPLNSDVHDVLFDLNVNMDCTKLASEIVHSYITIWSNISDAIIHRERQHARRVAKPMHNSDRDELCKGKLSVGPYSFS